MIVTIVGWIGAAALLTAFALLTAGRMAATGAVYLSLNFGGSAGLALSTAAAHAWPSSTVNVLWLAIGFGPLVRAWRRSEPAQAPGSRVGPRRRRPQLHRRSQDVGPRRRRHRPERTRHQLRVMIGHRRQP